MSLKTADSPCNSSGDNEAARIQLLQDATENCPADAMQDDPSGPEALFVGEKEHHDEKPNDDTDYEPNGEPLGDSDTEDGETVIDQDTEETPNDLVDGLSKDPKHRRGPAAKTAKEYVARVHAKKHEVLKEHIRTEKTKNKRTADGELDIAPPQPKRRRAPSKGKKPVPEQRAHAKSNQNEAIGQAAEMFHAISNVSESASAGAIPASSQQRVTKNARNKQISAQRTYGQDNRHRTTQRRDAKEAAKILGYGKVKCFGETSYQIQGMKSKIHDWQLTPVAWMVKRENAEMPPYGGVLADVPGMGKTVVSLSCVVGNPPDKKDVAEWSGATLVVLPSQVVADQWAEEIEKHLEVINEDDVYVFRKSRNTLSVGKIATFKIVELLAGFPSTETLDDLAEKHGKNPAEYSKQFRALVGDLFHINWYRVILDEVHQIKNLASRTCFAAHQLRSKHVWGLSGTPLVNRGRELFPYLKLIGVEGISTEEAFVKDFLNTKTDSAKLDALVNLVSYRRTEEDDFLGRKMLDLPQLHPGDQWVDLSTEERIIYDAIGKYYDNVHPQLSIIATLRRRQAISHPYCLEKCVRRDVQPRVIEGMAAALREVEGKKFVYHQIGTRVQRREAPVQPADSDDEEENIDSKSEKKKKKKVGKTKEKQPAQRAPQPIETSAEDHQYMDAFGVSDFGKDFSLAKLLELTSTEKLINEQRCGLCKRQGGVIDPMILELKKTDCPVNECSGKAEGWAHAETLSSEENECLMWDAADNDDGEDRGKPATKLSRKQKSEAAQLRKEAKKKVESKYGADYNGSLPITEPDNKAYVRIGVNNSDGVPCPSAKITCVKDILIQWQKEGPNDKIITEWLPFLLLSIFVQFVKTAIMTGIMLNLEHIPFVYLAGTMTPTEKTKAVKEFKRSPQLKILVALMKCGGQALNLTCANRVILIDAWWNNAAERQASGRVFRLGQIKNSHFVRILARGTVNEHITELQDDKSTEIARVLQDDGHVPDLLDDYEVLTLTAPRAWAELKARLLREIEEEEEEEEAAAEALTKQQPPPV
ncbi:SNF2 family domain-containing protein [Colletotrichum sojae]|uniref:SNF2 family domain-containing protein n=1 Tax=Colletotrichum sojae TaxID=2175907 RepID=A0A8H6MYN1_9PEZI|nr:SNF2 family domain-containing protein [Colletotrichum sojae]